MGQKPGGGKRSVMDQTQFQPFLSSIGEIGESGSSDEEAMTMHTHRLLQKDQMSSSAQNLRPTPGHFIESTFLPTAKGATSKPIRCTMESGTSTPPVEMEDKACCTESYVVNNKMAECITKLKTVSQRLDQNSPPSNSPIYSKVDMAGNQGVSLAASNGSPKTPERPITLETGASPFFSPPLPRKATESSFWSPGLRHKARKQKLDM